MLPARTGNFASGGVGRWQWRLRYHRPAMVVAVAPLVPSGANAPTLNISEEGGSCGQAVPTACCRKQPIVAPGSNHAAYPRYAERQLMPACFEKWWKSRFRVNLSSRDRSRESQF